MHICHRWALLGLVLIAGCESAVPPRPYWTVDRSGSGDRLVTVYLKDGTEMSTTINPSTNTAGQFTITQHGLAVDVVVNEGDCRVVGARPVGSTERIPSYKEAVKEHMK